MLAPWLAPLALLSLLLPTATSALTREEIDTARYQGGDLPPDQSALTAKLQVLLDRASVSPGVIDGFKGAMSESAIRAFEAKQGLEIDGVLGPEVWTALGGPTSPSVMQDYRITSDDLADVRGEPLPEDDSELAKLDSLGYERASEALAERFHMDEAFLIQLNPESSFAEGDTIVATAPGEPLAGEVVRIEVRTGTSRLAAFDEMIANYPVTIGSEDNPSPSGTMEVVAVAPNPTYTYDPENFQQGDNTEPLTLPAGLNGPVGSVWIDLSKPTYGLHGTAEPVRLFQQESRGCVRMTNWDAEELAGMVQQGTGVELIEG